MTALVALMVAALWAADPPRPLGLDSIAARVRAYPRLHQAYRLIERGELRAALPALEAARRLRPDDPEAERAYVVLLHALGDHRRTIAAAGRLLELAPGDGTALLYRGLSREATGDAAGAIADFNLAAADGLPEGDRVFALRSLAELQKKAGRPAAVVAALDRLPATTRDPLVHRMMAEAYAELGRDEAARREWLRAQALAPKDPVFLRALRDLDYRLGQLRSSLDWSQQLNAVTPTVDGLRFETQLLVRLEQYVDAIARIERRLVLDRSARGQRAALLEWAEIAQRQGDLMRERTLLERAAALGVAQPVLRRLGGLALRERNLEAARDWYRRSLALGRNADDLAALASLEFERGDYAEAIRLNRDLLPFVNLAVNQARIWMAIGWAEQQRGQFAAALTAFREAAARMPPPTGRRELATAALLNRQPELAATTIEEALTTDRDPQLRLQLALIHGDLGRHESAAALAEAALAGLADRQDRALAWRRIAYSRDRLGDWAGTRQALEKALEEGDHRPDLYRSLLEAALRMGDAAGAVRAARQLRDPDFETSLTAARAEAAAGNFDQAAQQLKRILGPAPPASAWRVLAQQADLEAARNRVQAAAELRLQAAAMPNAPRAQLLEQAAAGLVYNRDFAGARRAYLELAAGEENRARRAAIYEALGNVELELGMDEAAEATFRTAEELGADTGVRRAYLLLKRNQFAAAGALFDRAYQRTPEPQLARAAADAYQRAGDFVRALYWMERLLPPDPGLPVADRALRYREAAFLAARSGDDPRALRYWIEAQALAFDSTTALRLSRTKLRLGQPVTLGELDSVDPALLGSTDRIEYLDLKANLLSRAGRDREAAPLLELALSLDRSPVRAFELAEAYRRMGRLPEAIAQYRWVEQQLPADPAVASPLAYALEAVGDTSGALAVIEKSVRAHPAEPRLEAQFGYLLRAKSRNREAAAAFERALQGLDGAEARQIRYELDALRRQLNFLVYWSFTSPGLQESSFLGAGFGSAVPSQGGAEFAWRPPGIGFRNDRVVELFTRVLWANRFQSAAIAPESWQGAAGLRCKPLRRQNLTVSAERLFRLGDNAIASWLFRGLASFQHGESPWLTPRPTLYSTGLGDLSYFTNRETWLYFGQTRQGYSWPVARGWLLSPHAMVEVRYQDRAGQRVGYLQGGGGLALNIALEPNYEQAPRGRLEFLAQYRWGGFFSRHSSLPAREDFAGWFLSIAVVR